MIKYWVSTVTCRVRVAQPKMWRHAYPIGEGAILSRLIFSPGGRLFFCVWTMLSVSGLGRRTVLVTAVMHPRQIDHGVSSPSPMAS